MVWAASYHTLNQNKVVYLGLVNISHLWSAGLLQLLYTSALCAYWQACASKRQSISTAARALKWMPHASPAEWLCTCTGYLHTVCSVPLGFGGTVRMNGQRAEKEPQWSLLDQCWETLVKHSTVKYLALKLEPIPESRLQGEYIPVTVMRKGHSVLGTELVNTTPGCVTGKCSMIE